ncbi:MAG: lipoyl synthase [Ilumatobacter sp.]|uniref:lipoyl synthase n=1 Tax=Ilumatobacter sp. TaxID=1967498 RepID=UPI00260F9C95|nr:lipoyl synthase [Ilumatobacter sp.]MDJ0770798.1 lipoyl synthase [Ilumatobacter sp.]
MTAGPLRVRWLGRVPYREALAVQEALFEHGAEQHLLLLEHDHVFTYGRHADLDTNLRCEPASVGADLVPVTRGGDITYHGPGQLVGYPIVSLPNAKGSLEHVRSVEDLLIEALARLGVGGAGRLPDYPGVWVDADGPNPRKIAAIGVRLARGRTMHGFALNIDTDMRFMREHIVACGIADRPVTSLAEEGVDVAMREVVDVVAQLAAARWGAGAVERQDVAWRERPSDLAPFSRGEGPGERVTPRPRSHERLSRAGVAEGLSIESRKPDWLRPKVRHGPEVLGLRKTLRELELVTVCEDAGCPNLSDCWADGTATFMVLGERCTRACGFCLVDTRRPVEPSPDEPERVADAIDRLDLDHAVLTMVARDDLDDGGMTHVAACVEAIRRRRPATRVETLISDVKGSRQALGRLFDVRPDVLNHNLETVARLQRAVRPSAGYARSLAVLGWAKQAGLVTKSSVMVGLGETDAELVGALADLAAIGCDIVTIGQYLRPTSHHLPVARWVEPHEFARWKQIGESLGIGHVEAGPLTRSSYHAKQAAEQVGPVAVSLARTR